MYSKETLQARYDQYSNQLSDLQTQLYWAKNVDSEIAANEQKLASLVAAYNCVGDMTKSAPGISTGQEVVDVSKIQVPFHCDGGVPDTVNKTYVYGAKGAEVNDLIAKGEVLQLYKSDPNAAANIESQIAKVQALMSDNRTSFNASAATVEKKKRSPLKILLIVIVIAVVIWFVVKLIKRGQVA